MENMPDVKEWNFDDNEERSIMLFHVHVYFKRTKREWYPNIGYVYYDTKQDGLVSVQRLYVQAGMEYRMACFYFSCTYISLKAIQSIQSYIDYRGRGVASSLLDGLDKLYPRRGMHFRLSPKDYQDWVNEDVPKNVAVQICKQ